MRRAREPSRLWFRIRRAGSSADIPDQVLCRALPDWLQQHSFHQSAAHRRERLHQAERRRLHLQITWPPRPRPWLHSGRIGCVPSPCSRGECSVREGRPAPGLRKSSRVAMNFAEHSNALRNPTILASVAQPHGCQRQVIASSGALRIALDRQFLRLQCLTHGPNPTESSAVGGSDAMTEGLGLFRRSQLPRRSGLPCGAGYRVCSRPRRGLARAPKPSAATARRRLRHPRPSETGHHATCVSTCLRVRAKACADAPRPRRATGARAPESQINPAGDQVRAQFDRPLQGSFGVDLAALLAQQAAEIHPRGGKVRAQDQRATVAGFSSFSFPMRANTKPAANSASGSLDGMPAPACNAEAPLHSAPSWSARGPGPWMRRSAPACGGAQRSNSRIAASGRPKAKHQLAQTFRASAFMPSRRMASRRRAQPLRCG